MRCILCGPPFGERSLFNRKAFPILPCLYFCSEYVSEPMWSYVPLARHDPVPPAFSHAEQIYKRASNAGKRLRAAYRADNAALACYMATRATGALVCNAASVQRQLPGSQIELIFVRCWPRPCNNAARARIQFTQCILRPAGLRGEFWTYHISADRLAHTSSRRALHRVLKRPAKGPTPGLPPTLLRRRAC